MVLTYLLSHWIGSVEPVATTEAGKAITDSAKKLLLMRALIWPCRIPLVWLGTNRLVCQSLEHIAHAAAIWAVAAITAATIVGGRITYLVAKSL